MDQTGKALAVGLEVGEVAFEAVAVLAEERSGPAEPVASEVVPQAASEAAIAASRGFRPHPASLPELTLVRYQRGPDPR